MPPFDVLFKNKSNNSQNKKPGVLGEKADNLTRSFKKEADDRADEPRKK